MHSEVIKVLPSPGVDPAGSSSSSRSSSFSSGSSHPVARVYSHQSSREGESGATPREEHSSAGGTRPVQYARNRRDQQHGLSSHI